MGKQPHEKYVLKCRRPVVAVYLGAKMNAISILVEKMPNDHFTIVGRKEFKFQDIRQSPTTT